MAPSKQTLFDEMTNRVLTEYTRMTLKELVCD